MRTFCSSSRAGGAQMLSVFDLLSSLAFPPLSIKSFAGMFCLRNM